MMRHFEIHRLEVCALALSVMILCFTGAALAVGEECRTKSYQDKIPCYKQALEQIVQTQGTEQALDTLQQLASVDLDVRQESHPYAHHIGRFSFSHYRDVTSAFNHCKDTFASGCYHGVLEGYLSTFSELEPQHVSSICSDKQMDPRRTVFLKFLCVHGLGHGLTMYFHHDLFKALTFCDALPVARDQETCYAGVFMENIVAFIGRDHAAHSTHAAYLDPHNLLYPCTVVDRRYQRACYLMQSSAILPLTNYDFTRAFRECDKAPPDLIATCYQSMGRDASGVSLTNPEKTRILCLMGRPDYIGQCFAGAAKDAIYVYADAQRGIALCRVTDGPYKADCYAGVREFLVDFYADQKKQDQACLTAEEAYQSLCRGIPITRQ